MRPEDEDDFKSIATEQFVDQIPVVGNNIVTLERGFGGGDIAPARSTGSARRRPIAASRPWRAYPALARRT
jgi:hypothetical protein